MEKYKKVCQKLRSMPKVLENVQIAIFAVQMLFFWCAGNFFFKAQYKLLPPHGKSFATLECDLLFLAVLC